MSTDDEVSSEVDFRVTTRSMGRPPETETQELREKEELSHLKKKKSGHLGFLNRIYREIEDLMIDPANYDQVLNYKQSTAYDN